MEEARGLLAQIAESMTGRCLACRTFTHGGMMTQRNTILVADDDLTALTLMRAALEKAGFCVRTAIDGEEALRQFRTEPCDLVMLDVDMPHRSGHEVCATLRLEAGPLLPIVMVTAWTMCRRLTALSRWAPPIHSKPINWRSSAIASVSAARLSDPDRPENGRGRNAAVLHALPDLLFELDVDGRFIQYDAPRAELCTMPDQGCIGRTVHEILSPQSAGVCMSAVREAVDQGLSAGKQIELAVAKGTVWFELSASRKLTEAGHTPTGHRARAGNHGAPGRRGENRRLAYFDSLTGLPNRDTSGPASRMRWTSHAGIRGSWHCYVSIWIISNASTTPWVMGWATRCCAWSLRACAKFFVPAARSVAGCSGAWTTRRTCRARRR